MELCVVDEMRLKSNFYAMKHLIPAVKYMVLDDLQIYGTLVKIDSIMHSATGYFTQIPGISFNKMNTNMHPNQPRPRLQEHKISV